LQQPGKDHVSNREHALAEPLIQQFGLWNGHAVDAVNPGRGVDDDHFSWFSVASHRIQSAGPLQLAACAADPLLPPQPNHQPQAVPDGFAPGAGAGEFHRFCDPLVIDADVGAQKQA